MDPQGFPSLSSSSDLLTVIIIIGVILLVIALIGAIFYFSRQSSSSSSSSSSSTSPPPTATLAVSRGAGSNITDPGICSQDPKRRQWVVDADGRGSCQCNFPFSGPDCSIEQYDMTYQDAGNLAGAQVYPLYTTMTENLSYSSKGTSCTQLCNLNKDCIGVIYDPSGSCTLLKDKITYSPQNIPTPANPRARLYTKKSHPIEVRDQVVVYSGTLPANYWTIPGPFHQVLDLDKVYRLNFYPTSILGHRKGLGILSPVPIPADYNTLKNYISNPPPTISLIPANSKEIHIPARWLPLKEKSIYIAFLSQ